MSERYCKICGRLEKATDGTSVCECLGIQTYSLSNYPGEFKMTETHPSNQDEQFYKREDIDSILKSLGYQNQNYEN